jgi:hypothetical protein
MELDQLTNEQVASLTPEEIETLENAPEKLDEIMAAKGGKATDEPEQEEQEGAANGAGEEEEPVVLNKSGKGVIPYEKHKELRVENSTLKQQLQDAQSKLDELLKAKDEAGSKKDVAKADDAIAAHLENLKSDMPELHTVITAVLEGSRKQGEKLEKTLEELKREREESERIQQQSVAEQVAEAKDNNPDLVHWEGSDPDAWDEALRQDEILRTNSKWANKPYAERFEEVVRRVRAIMPEASAPKKQADPEKVKAEAKAKVEKAPARKPTTLSDIQGGTSPAATEAEQIANMHPQDLTKKLLTMPAHKAKALRAGLD